MVGGIILGERNWKEYTGKRFAYEWDCCWLGWSLAQLNPTLLEQKGLLQRATDNVASFVFEGCMSRTKSKSHRNEKHKSRDAKLPLHDWERHMMARPEWFPGLDQDKKEKERLKKLYKLADEEYNKRVRGTAKDAKTLELASRDAVSYYANHVTPNMFAPATNQGQKSKEVERKAENAAAMSYINIPADPHMDTKETPQIRVNVLTDKVCENVISDSVRHKGMVFIDVFDTTGMNDTSLKARVTTMKEVVEYYKRHEIGLVRHADLELPSLDELIRKCCLDLKEYETLWENFKLELNGLGFKIVSIPEGLAYRLEIPRHE